MTRCAPTSIEDRSSILFSRSARVARRGAVFITALGIILILTGLVLVFGQRMRIETTAAANRSSYIQADAVEKGAELWVLSQVESYPADAVTITTVPAEALPIGSGYFWILRPDPTQDQTYGYGITDESSKLNINTATSDQVMLLPNMTDQDIADSIVDWAASADDPPGPNGAQSDYYESLVEPYSAKNSPYETVEELLLVKDVTTDLLYGSDLNHDGVIDTAEQKIAGTGSVFGGVNGTTTDSRGIFNYVTCYTVEPNTSITGTKRVNVNNKNTTGLQAVLAASLSASRTTAVLTQVASALTSRNPIVFPTIGSFYTRSTLTSDEFALVADRLTASASPTLPGLINVNTAPAQVLQALPGLSESDAQALISQRTGGANTGSIAWVFTALSSSKATAVAGDITARSFQYSADIVAVSGNGRAFKRVRIVVDSRTTPAKIVYRKDLTSLGWPLPPEVRDSMRSGKGVPDSAQGLGGSLNNALH